MAKKRNRRKQVIPENETKPARFVRVVSPRVVKAIKAIKQIGFCTGSTYEFTTQQTEQIIIALSKELTALSNKFKGTIESTSEFMFDK